MKLFTVLIGLALTSLVYFPTWAQNTQSGASQYTAASSSERAPGKRPSVNTPKGYPWTLQFTHSIDSLNAAMAGIETDGTYFYAPVWNNDTIYKFNLNGAFVEKFVISGVSNLRDLAYDGTYFYGGAASNAIYKMNFTTKTLVSTITAPSGVQARHINYDPIHNAVWCGNWSTDIWCVSLTNGNVIDTIPALGNGISGTYGSAFDTISPGGPYMWLFDQSGNLVTLYQVNVNTKSLTGLVYDISNDISLPSGSSAGGLFIEPGLVSNTVTLGGLVQGSMIFGYDLASTQPDSIDIGVAQVLSPFSGYNKSSNETVKIVVKNFGSTAVSSYTVGYSFNGGSTVTQTVSNSLAAFASDTITFTSGANMSTQGSYNFSFFTSLSADNNHNNDTLQTTVDHLAPTSTFPYAESFETGFGGWVQSNNDILNWTRYAGSTPSTGTGPTAAYDGTYYCYTEMSGYNTGDSSIMSMPFNISALTSPYFKFAYHMNGSNIGSFYVNIYDGTSTDYKVWTKSGSQGSSWLVDSINLSSYNASSYIEIQLVAVRGSSWSSDIAVDDISIYDTYVAPPTTVPNLVITEINYNPPESGTDTLEFIEIYNNDANAVNLAGYSFTQGFNYTFPAVSIPAGGYLVIAADSVKVNNFFNISAYQWTSGGLSNGGEDICLVTNNGDTVDYVDYDDNTPWPTLPDGNGPSLTLCNPTLDNNSGANWSASTNFVGLNANNDSIFASPGAPCSTTPPPASAFKVLLVDDDNYGSDESSRIDTALAHSGYTYAFIDIASSSMPTYNDLKNYDLVIWSTANDGTSLNLWDVSDTATNGPGAIKFNSALSQYLDSNGYVWVDGIDFIYDIYGSAPYDFNAGDFCYDVMGIDKYKAQSHADDTLGSYSGVPLAYRSANNNFTQPDTIRWKWSSLWYGDAFEITGDASALYNMGPAGYDFFGSPLALYKGHVVTSSLRIGSMGNGSSYDQVAIDSLVGSMVRNIENGLPQANPNPTGDTIPPTATFAEAINGTTVIVTFSEAVGSSAETTSNYTGLGTITSAVRNAGMDTVTLTLATALSDGMGYTLVVDNVKDTAGNTMYAAQNFNILFNASQPSLLITEIMYNDPSAIDSLEYFEIYNNGSTTAHLGGCTITQGVHYTFPAGTDLAASAYLVMAKDSALVNSVFSINGTHQWASGGLKNSGEDIEIQNMTGDVLAYVDYDDSAPWPVEADGDGYSLAFCDYTLTNNDGNNWTLSALPVAVFNNDTIYGTPGQGCIFIGFEEPGNELTLSMFPNPAVDRLTLITNGDSYRLSIYNLNGKQLVNKSISGHSNTLSLKALTSGMYYLQLVHQSSGQIISRKLIIQ